MQGPGLPNQSHRLNVQQCSQDRLGTDARRTGYQSLHTCIMSYTKRVLMDQVLQHLPLGKYSKQLKQKHIFNFNMAPHQTANATRKLTQRIIQPTKTSSLYSSICWSSPRSSQNNKPVEYVECTRKLTVECRKKFMQLSLEKATSPRSQVIS